MAEVFRAFMNTCSLTISKKKKISVTIQTNDSTVLYFVVRSAQRPKRVEIRGIYVSWL